MKASLLQKAVTVALLASSVLAGGAQADPGGQRTPEKTLQQDAAERYVYVTGSHIPQKVKRRSIGTDTAYNIRIYSDRELQSTGRSTVGEALTVLDPSLQLRH